jgi:Tol biopolymer transport system component
VAACIPASESQYGTFTVSAWIGNTEILGVENGVIHLVTIGAHSTNRALVPNVGRMNSNPMLNKDGTRFAFLSNLNGSPEQLWLGSISGGKLQEISGNVSGEIIGWQ